MTVDQPTLLLLGALVLAALAAWLTLLLRRAYKARLLARQMSRAASAEQLAERWLTERGHRVLARQLPQQGVIRVDGAEDYFDIRADLLVAMGAERVIVEVKTGEAANPRSALTRRQLREYAAVFDVAAIYLFDADRRELHRIEFPDRS